MCVCTQLLNERHSIFSAPKSYFPRYLIVIWIFPHYFSLCVIWETTGGVVWYQTSVKSGQPNRKFPFKLKTSNLKPYLFNDFSIDSLIEIQRVAIKLSAQRDPLCERGAGVKEKFEITRLFPTSPVSEASRAAALHRAVLRLSIMSAVAGNHNRAGEEGCLGTRGPWPTAKHTHKSCCTLAAF